MPRILFQTCLRVYSARQIVRCSCFSLPAVQWFGYLHVSIRALQLPEALQATLGKARAPTTNMASRQRNGREKILREETETEKCDYGRAKTRYSGTSRQNRFVTDKIPHPPWQTDGMLRLLGWDSADPLIFTGTSLDVSSGTQEVSGPAFQQAACWLWGRQSVLTAQELGLSAEQPTRRT